MDSNKADKLREIGYSIPNHCGICVHAFIAAGSQWGTCRRHCYDHLKHSGPARQLSICRQGHCGDFKRDDCKVGEISDGFKQFIEGVHVWPRD